MTRCLPAVLIAVALGCGGTTSHNASHTTAGAAGSATGGVTGSGGARGGSPGLGGTSGGGTGALGGTVSGGAGGAAGSPNAWECTRDADCHVVGDCCGCWSLPVGSNSTCALACALDRCTEFATRPAPRCSFGRCVLDVSCNGSVLCNMAPPSCGSGSVATVQGGCYGPCVSATECPNVADCTVCNWPTQACVFEYGAAAVAHCVDPGLRCKNDVTCGCLGGLCGSITPCTDLPHGIACGGG